MCDDSDCCSDTEGGACNKACGDGESVYKVMERIAEEHKIRGGVGSMGIVVMVMVP